MNHMHKYLTHYFYFCFCSNQQMTVQIPSHSQRNGLAVHFNHNNSDAVSRCRRFRRYTCSRVPASPRPSSPTNSLPHRSRTKMPSFSENRILASPSLP